MPAHSTPDQEIEREWNDVLRTYPIAPAPRGLSKSVMQKVETSIAIPKFRLSWFDYALTLFLTSMFGLILVLGNLLPRDWATLARFRTLLLLERSLHYTSTTNLIGGSILVMAAIAVVILCMKPPRLVANTQ